MKENDVKTIEVEGAVCEMEPCDHCHQEATPAEAEIAVRQAQRTRATPQFRCAYCGETIRVTRYVLRHYTIGWSAEEKELEPWLRFGPISPLHGPACFNQNGLHERCVSKSMPFLNYP
jgi:hypothetical protein